MSKYTVGNVLKNESDFAECLAWSKQWVSKLADKGLSQKEIAYITASWFIDMKNGKDRPLAIYRFNEQGQDCSIWL